MRAVSSSKCTARRLGVRLGIPLHDGDRAAAVGEQQREPAAHRARADDQDVEHAGACGGTAVGTVVGHGGSFLRTETILIN